MDRLASFPGLADVLVRGDTKMSIRLDTGLQIDLRVVPKESFGAALQYFSFVTITTLGYGDVQPVIPIARSLAITEALFGQIYLVTLIARLVSMESDQKLKSNRSSDEG